MLIATETEPDSYKIVYHFLFQHLKNHHTNLNLQIFVMIMLPTVKKQNLQYQA